MWGHHYVRGIDSWSVKPVDLADITAEGNVHGCCAAWYTMER
jgi:hypothetical protein